MIVALHTIKTNGLSHVERLKKSNKLGTRKTVMSRFQADGRTVSTATTVGNSGSIMPVVLCDKSANGAILD